MSKLVKVLEKEELPDGTGKLVPVEGKVLAIFRVNGDYFATANSCLHRGGPLGEGDLDDYQVICPWHGWRYDVRSGAFTVIRTLKVKTYRVQKQEDGIFVEV